MTARVFVFGRDGDASSGNIATVVSDAKARSFAKIAANNATAATAFLLGGEPNRVRFFTPTSELEMCAHGALAAGAVEARRRGVPRVTLLVANREIIVDCSMPGVATLVMNGGGSVRIESDPTPLIKALRATAHDVLAPTHIASVGSPKWLVEILDDDALRRLRPDMQALARLSDERGVNGVYAFTRDGAGDGVDLLARAFNPRAGVDEDAATGVAAAALAWLWRDRLNGRELVIDQGIELRDLNRIRARVDGDEIRVGGNVVITEEQQ